MLALAIVAVVLVIGLMLATGVIPVRNLPEELNGYPVPMLIFSAIAVVGIFVAGMV